MNKLEKLGAKIISQLTIDSEFGWPPDCNGLIYQPERPVEKPVVTQDTVSEISVLEKDRNK